MLMPILTEWVVLVLRTKIKYCDGDIIFINKMLYFVNPFYLSVTLHDVVPVTQHHLINLYRSTDTLFLYVEKLLNQSINLYSISLYYGPVETHWGGYTVDSIAIATNCRHQLNTTV